MNIQLFFSRFFPFIIVGFLLVLESCQNETASGTSTVSPEPSSSTSSGINSDQPLFKLRSPQTTGIDFVNSITETASFNHLFWTSIYNGGGVGIGDINQDGLPDIYFCGNTVRDRLYLNQGNLKFKDITNSSGLLGDGKWSSGVTMADVNQDGYLDIYVCRFGQSNDPEQRRNLLYINNKNNTFAESAKRYGLDYPGFSTQASFFDLDKDGDLDLYLVSQPLDQRKLQSATEAQRNSPLNSDRLYQNNGKGKFIDITQKAGVTNRAHGLNVMAGDLNQDGWTDLYVTNDYDEPDHFYINNKKGGFTDLLKTSVQHISNFAMGSDVADFNNDGLLDIAALDMASEDHYRSKTNMGSMSNKRFWANVKAGNYYQFMVNTLQLNNGNGTFSEIGQMAGINKTDWSWGIVMADFDNDGYKDMAVTNGIQKDIRNNDFLLNIRNKNKAGQKDFNVPELVNSVPSNPIPNYLFKNNGDLTFAKVSKAWGFSDPGFSQGIAYADLDLDGDLDLVISNLSKTASVYENIGMGNNYIRFKLEGAANNFFGLNAKVELKSPNGIQFQELTLTKGYLSSSEPIVHFGVGQQKTIDQVIVTWPNGKQTVLKDLPVNKLYTVNIKTARNVTAVASNAPLIFQPKDNLLATNFRHQENEYDDFLREILLPYKQSQNGPYITVGDANKDGKDDFFVGGAVGVIGQLFLQSSDGSFKGTTQNAWEVDKASEDLGVHFFDADQDDDLDLYVVSGGTEYENGNPLLQDRLYLNDGSGNFSKVNSNLPVLYESGQTVISNDIDKDGDLDLFVGGRLIPGKYPLPANSRLLINNGGKFMDATKENAPDLLSIGLVTDAVFSDFDVDGDADLVLVGEGMPMTFLANTNGKFERTMSSNPLSEVVGLWWSISEGDFNKDGRPDYVAGNLGKNSKFKASPKKPFLIFGNDFDGNGSNDVVLANYSNDKLVPVRGRECSSEQMPFIAEKFPSYDAFARAELTAILPKDKMDKAAKYEITSFASSVIMNNGDNNFTVKPLENQAQIAPIRASTIVDINADGHLDILGVGNLYAAEVETVRYDAGIGWTLLGDGKGNFSAMPVTKSGWYAPYDARSIVVLNENDKKPLFIIGNNQERLQIFQMSELAL